MYSPRRSSASPLATAFASWEVKTSSGSTRALGLISTAPCVLRTSTRSPSCNPRSLHRLLGIATRRPFPTRTVEETMRFVFFNAMSIEYQTRMACQRAGKFQRVLDRSLDVDFGGLGQRAEKVRTLSSKIEWVERFRAPSETQQFPADDSEIANAQLLEWLALGKLVRVGKHTAWGNGWIRAGEAPKAGRT
jgi:hypothetical protein